jgi:AcrR family transcriptional regulator
LVYVVAVGVEAERSVRRRDRAATRAALLTAAAEVFARSGLADATLEEIAETAGFTRGAVYHHFASKEALFLAVIARRDVELLAGYLPDVLGAYPPDTHAAAQRWRELHAADRIEVALRLELRSQAMRNEVLREQLLAVDRAAVAATAERLTEVAAEAGVRWKRPVADVAELLHAVSHAASERAALSGDDATALMELMIELVWNGSLDDPSTGR